MLDDTCHAAFYHIKPNQNSYLYLFLIVDDGGFYSLRDSVTSIMFARLMKVVSDCQVFTFHLG